MARLRRVTALFLALLLTELLLVGSGYACAMREAGMSSENGSTADTPPMVATAGVADIADDEDCADAMPASTRPTDGPASDEPSCPLPWAPAGCHGAPCAPATLAAAAPPLSASARRPAERTSLAVTPPASVVRAPELPPPRA